MQYLHKILLALLCLNCFFPNSISGQEEKDDAEINYDKADKYFDEDYEQEDNKDQLELAKECISLKSVKLKRICKSVYPENVLNIHSGNLVDAHDPYAVFQFPDKDKNHYFLTFQLSPLIRCEQLEVIDAISFKCSNGTGDERNVTVKMGTMICINHPSEMVDELVYICSPTDLKNSVFSALHYAGLHSKKRSTGCNVKLALSWWLKLELVMLGIVYYWCAIFDT